MRRERNESGTPPGTHENLAGQERDKTDTAAGRTEEPPVPTTRAEGTLKVVVVSAETLQPAGPAQLVLLEPPGRSTRKALAFSGEIQRLRALGYTLGAIRQALTLAGINVSRSTVHREAARHQQAAISARQPAVPTIAAPPEHPLGSANRTSPRTSSSGPPPPCPLADLRSGKDIAEEWFREHPSNPLFRNKGSQ